MECGIMIVDDDDMIREAVDFYFQAKGMQILTAESCGACLRHLEEGFRGVILMDVMMPGKDGWDTIREIVARELFPGNAIVMLTARDEPDAKMEGLQGYIIDYMTKPFNPADMFNTVSYYLGLLKNGVAPNV